MNKVWLGVALMFATLVGTAQDKLKLDDNLANKWLLEVEGDTVTAGEFWTVFNKNNYKQEMPSKESLLEYFDLFQKFKLKVKEAEDLGLDTTYKFKKEIEGYRKQLAESYLTDKSVTEDLVKEAYERSKWEISASHILIGTKYHAIPSDTLEAYTKAKSVQLFAKAGHDFDSLAIVHSSDPSAKSNKGYLGYFSAFKMVYPFESAAFNTKVGEISEIVKTRFGYHIIKVHAKRKTTGSIKVAHIMTVLKDTMSAETKAQKKAKIDEVYAELEKGAPFDLLARKYSEHFNSASNGGGLPWFSAGQYDPAFENAAFEIENNGEYSKPVKSSFGWHIIKRLDKKSMESFEEVETDIRKKVSRSDRAAKSKDVVIDRIKKKYNFKENKKRKYLNWFFENGDSTIVQGTWKRPKGAKLKKVLFEFADRKWRQHHFAFYLENTLRPRKGGDYRHIVNYMYEGWVEMLLLKHEEKMLPKTNQSYVQLMKEYRDGIILFDLTDEKVWAKAVKDTAGLRKYYEENQSKWMWNTRLDGELYTCSEKKYATQVKKMLNSGVGMVKILEDVNKASQLNIRVENVLADTTKKPQLSVFPPKVGVSEIYEYNDSYLVMKIEKVLPPAAKELDVVKGLVAAEYQDALMKEWIDELSKKYILTFNKESLKELIRHVE